MTRPAHYHSKYNREWEAQCQEAISPKVMDELDQEIAYLFSEIDSILTTYDYLVFLGTLKMQGRVDLRDALREKLDSLTECSCSPDGVTACPVCMEIHEYSEIPY